jgi:plastocyanin
MSKSLWITALALSAGMCSASFGQVTGKVTLKGKAPEMAEIAGIKNAPDCAKMHKDPVFEETVITGDKGELANVVVSVKVPEGKDLGTTPTTPVMIDQKGCVYSPHVVAVAVGQPVTVKNSDSTLHNVHSLAIDNPAFNFGQPTVGQKKIEPFKTEENFKIKCDVHPWMACWVRVVNNPYFAVTSSDDKAIGTYSIDAKGLPDGEYTFVAWHEKYGTQEQKGKVAGGKAVVDFTFDTEKKAAAPAAKELKVSTTAACCDAKGANAVAAK